MNRLLSYTDKDTWIHRLSGITKLLFFLLWTITSAMTYDTRVLILMILISLALYRMSKTEWRQVRGVFRAVLFFIRAVSRSLLYQIPRNLLIAELMVDRG